MQRIQVTLDMEGQRLGIEAEPALEGTALHVKDIHPGGAVFQWNLNNPPSKGVRPGDHVVAINDHQGAKAMIEECKAGRKRLVLMVEGAKRGDVPSPPGAALGPPANRIAVHLDMGMGLKLGIDMDYSSDPRAIYITNVKPDGAVMHWNRSNPPSLGVQTGDRIVGVNHVEGDSKAMINEGTKCFKGKLKVTLHIESQRQPNLIVTPGLAAVPAGPGPGVKRSMPNSFTAPEGGDTIAHFVARWGLTPEAEGFLRNQSPPTQEMIMKDFKPAQDTRDFTARFLIFAKSIVNAGQGRSAKGTERGR